MHEKPHVLLDETQDDQGESEDIIVIQGVICPLHRLTNLIDTDTAQLLLSPTQLVSMESKYTVSRHIAEFWCTITSPLFALACITWIVVPSPTPLVSFCCIFSIVTSLASVAYHATNMHGLGLLDCCCAVIMVFLSGIQSFSVAYPDTFISENRLAIAVSAMLTGFTVFFFFWRFNSALYVTMFLSATPLLCVALIHLHLLVAVLIGALGMASYLLDRKKVAPLHSLWHLFGGLAVMFAITFSAYDEYNSTVLSP